MSNKVSFSESDHKVKKGELSQIWNADRAFPKIKGIQIAFYYFRRALKAISALPSSTLITIVTVAISLFLFGGFVLLLQNVQKVISDSGNSSSLTIYLQNEITDEKLSHLVEEIEKNTLVTSLSYLTKEQAFELFKTDLGNSSFVKSLEGENPFPPSMDIELEQAVGGEEEINELRELFLQYEVVDEVVFGAEWVDNFESTINVVRFFGFLILLIIFLVVMLLISNTIRLVIYSRSDEIKVMRLIGATDSFIKIPFVLGGVIQGFLGALFGMFFLRVCFSVLDYQLIHSVVLGVALPRFVFLHPVTIIFIVIFGMTIGALGSLFALRKFINV